MRLTKEQIEERLNGLIEEICDAERDCANAEGRAYQEARAQSKEVRKRVMDALLEIYIG